MEASLLHVLDQNSPSIYVKWPRKCQKTYNFDNFFTLPQFYTSPLLNFWLNPKFNHIILCVYYKSYFTQSFMFLDCFVQILSKKNLGGRVSSTPFLGKGRVKAHKKLRLPIIFSVQYLNVRISSRTLTQSANRAEKFVWLSWFFKFCVVNVNNNFCQSQNSVALNWDNEKFLISTESIKSLSCVSRVICFSYQFQKLIYVSSIYQFVHTVLAEAFHFDRSMNTAYPFKGYVHTVLISETDRHRKFTG